MTPRQIVRTALQRRLDAIAICDHNASENVESVVKAADGSRLVVLPGIEITTCDQIHVLGYFPDLAKLARAQRIVNKHLLERNDENFYGIQVIADEHDHVVGFNERLLAGCTQLTLKETVALIHKVGGLAVAAHVDKQKYSLLAVLGSVPIEIDLDAVEVHCRAPVGFIEEHAGKLARKKILRSSDSHRLSEIGRVTMMFEKGKPGYRALRDALQGEAA
jgi:predicted metal-dependent phosphoesterase TrpH